eukprot:gene2488-2831_t
MSMNEDGGVIRHVLEDRQWNVPQECDILMIAVELASKQKALDLEVIKFFSGAQFDDRHEITQAVMDGAAAKGALDVVQYLHGRSEGCTTMAMDQAAAGGHLVIVEFLDKHRTEGCTTVGMDQAAGNGHLETVIYLNTKRTEGCTTDAMNFAAINGHLETLIYLDTNRTEGCTHAAMDEAAANGHIEIVKYLHTKRTEGCSQLAMNSAASNGHIEIVKYLHANRSEGCTTDAMDYASLCGDIAMVTWLHEYRTEGCTHEAMEMAANSGHFYEDDDDLNKVIARSHTDPYRQQYDKVVQFINVHRTEGHSPNFFVYAAQNHSLGAIAYLQPETEYCWELALLQASDAGALEWVQYILTNHFVETESIKCAFEGACSFNHLEILKYITRNHELSQLVGLYMGCVRGNLGIVKYLLENNPTIAPTVKDQQDVLMRAILAGDLALIEYLVNDKKFAVPKDIPPHAYPNYRIITLLCDLGCNLTPDFICNAIEAGTLPIVKHALSKNPQHHSRYLVSAVQCTQIEILHYLCEHPAMVAGQSEEEFTSLVHIMLDGTHSMSCLQLLLDHYTKKQSLTLTITDRSSLSLLLLLQTRGYLKFVYTPPEEFYNEQADQSPLTTRRNLFINYPCLIPTNNDTQPTAHKFTPFAKYILNETNGIIRFDEWNINDTPFISTLPLLSSVGQCTDYFMDIAAMDDLTLVQYLDRNRTEGCTAEAMNNAAVGSNLSIVQYLSANRTEGCTFEAMDVCGSTGNLSMIQYLHKTRTEGCSISAMDNAASGGFLTIVQYLHSQRTEGCTTLAMDLAASNGHYTIVKFLLKNRSEGCTQNALDHASVNGKYSIVKLLLNSNLRSALSIDKAISATEEGNPLMVKYLKSFQTSKRKRE